jgi:hypothetical protein
VIDFIHRLATSLPTPSPTPSDFNEDTVTPGWEGFTVIFLVAVVVVLLIVDMVRRIRRVRYREEVRAQLASEAEATKDAD